ncbi:MAG: SDR family oxidoreductase, partial [Henriciella sp.]
RNIATLADTTSDTWLRVLAVNVAGTAAVCRRCLPLLRVSGAGSIVNVSSAYALVGRRSWGEYDASKAALVALTRSLACEEAQHNIRVNAICPGSTLTPWTLGRAEDRGLSEDELRSAGAAGSMLGRWADPEEIAYPILWLASAEASFVTGAILPVDGGLTAM